MNRKERKAIAESADRKRSDKVAKKPEETKEYSKLLETRRNETVDSKSLTVPENLELLFMYQELLGRGLEEWEKKMKP